MVARVASGAVVKVLVSVVSSSCWCWGGKDAVLGKEADGGDGVDDIFSRVLQRHGLAVFTGGCG